MLCAVVVTHRRPDELAKSLDALAAQTPSARSPDRRRQRQRRAGARPGGRPADPDHLSGLAPKPRRRRRIRARHAARAGTGRGLGLAGRRRRPARRTRDVLATLLACAERHGLAEVSPMVCDIDDPERLPFRCAGDWCGGDGSANCARRCRDRICCRASRRCSTARCSGRRRWRRSACPICGCSCAATRWRCTAGWCAPGCRSAPA